MISIIILFNIFFRLYLTAQIWNKDSVSLFDFKGEDITLDSKTITKSGNLYKYGYEIKYIPHVKKDLPKYSSINPKDRLGTINIIDRDKYVWEYQKNLNTLQENTIPELSWMVIGYTELNKVNKPYSYYKLKEGDIIKIGKIIFYVREINTGVKISNNNLNTKLANNANANVKDTGILDKINTNKYESACRKIAQNFDLNVNNGCNKRNGQIYLNQKQQKVRKVKKETCKICLSEGEFGASLDSNPNPLINPCNCTGSVRFTHLDCLRHWFYSKIAIEQNNEGTVTSYTFKQLECEICKAKIPLYIKYQDEYISLIEIKNNVAQPYMILESIPFSVENSSMNLSNAENKVEIFTISFSENNFIQNKNKSNDKYKQNMILVGRNTDSDMRISDISVSRKHAKIYYYDYTFFIEDYNSKFGTSILIQDDIVFLPYRIISLQRGKYLLSFLIERTLMSCLKCYTNEYFRGLSYDKLLEDMNLNVYYHETNNNIKKLSFQDISSCSSSEKEDEHSVDNSSSDSGREVKSEKLISKSCKRMEFNINTSNSNLNLKNNAENKGIEENVIENKENVDNIDNININNEIENNFSREKLFDDEINPNSNKMFAQLNKNKKSIFEDIFNKTFNNADANNNKMNEGSKHYGSAVNNVDVRYKNIFKSNILHNNYVGNKIGQLFGKNNDNK